MELRQLKTFRTVATLRSFNRAAVLLDYAQSTVSEQIKALETDLDVRLFKRAGRRVTLTDAGEILLLYSQKILNLEEEIRTEVDNSEEVHGSLSIRIPETVSTYYLPVAFKKFHQRFPKVSFNLINCSYFGLLEEFRSGIINLAFLISDNFKATGIETEKLFSLPLAIVVSPSHPLTTKEKIDLHDVTKETLLVPSADCSYVMMLEKMLTEEKVRLSTVLHFNCIEAIKQFVMAGAGLTVLPQIAVEQEIAAGRLVELSWLGGPIYADLLMIWQKNKWLPPILEEFIKITRETLVSP